MKLKECCTLFTDGNWIESKDQSETGIRLIQTGNVGNGEFLEKEARAKYISEETFKRLKCIEIYAGDILISRLPDPVGRACVIPERSERMITAVDCSILRLDEKVVNKRYLLHYLKSQCYFNQLAGKLAGTTRTRISRKNLEQVELVLPDLRKQEEVAEVLDSIVTIMKIERKQLLSYDNLIKSRFVEMFKEHLDQEGKLLSELACITGGLTKNSKRASFDIKMPYLRVANVFFNRLDLNEILEIGVKPEEIKKTMLQKGDLLFVEGNGSLEQIGRVAVWDGSIEPCLHQNHLIKARFKNCNIVSEYALFYFMSQEGRQQIISKSVSTSGLNTLSVNKIGNLLIPVPPVGLQEQFATFVHEIDKLKVERQKSLEKTQLLFDSLMQKYFG